MYASQTKRLCVRGSPPDETRVHQHSSSEQSARGVSQQQQQQQLVSSSVQQPTNSENTVAGIIMTASTTGALADPNQESTNVALNVADLQDVEVLGETNERILIDKLVDESNEENKLRILLHLRNLSTACNKKKESILKNTNFSVIIKLIDDSNTSVQVKVQLALLLCSLAKGGENNVKSLSELQIDAKILRLLSTSESEPLIEACLRCLRAMLSWRRVSRTWLLYESQSPANTNGSYKNQASLYQCNLQKIIEYAANSSSHIVQECVADIFASTCSRNKDQILLFRVSAIFCVVRLLESQSTRVVLASLNWLTQLCLKNNIVSAEVASQRCPSGILVLDLLTKLMSKDRCHEMQLLSARCFAYIYRALGPEVLGDDPRIINIVLPTLIRMVHKDKQPHLRIKAAECIAYFIESETRLQATASICDHLIDSLANMLDYEQNTILFEMKDCTPTQYKCSRVQDRGVSWLSITAQQPSPTDLIPPQLNPSKLECSLESQSETNQEMKRAAFLALASLASNLEHIRKKIFNTCSVIKHLVKSLTDSDTKTLKSVLTCLLSLSRSVQQLRTSFNENSVYSALKSLLNTTSNDVLILVLAILCNISLDFSPGKQYFLDSKTIEVLCNLTRKSDSVLRLHGMWILMNMTYQVKDQNLKFQILRTLDLNHVVNILENETDEEIVLKTLGFLRNLLSQKPHIDAIMSNHGEHIMLAITKLLENTTSSRIKEQTLCVLGNIADGNESKKFIMNSKPSILSILSRTMMDERAENSQLAAIFCITNLAHKDFEGSFARRDEMRRYGIENKLKSLLDSKDPLLSDRVRTAYNQFSTTLDDVNVD